MEMLEGKEETANVKVKKDKVTQSFGELIREYQKAGYSNRESIEKAYSKMYDKDETKKKKETKKKIDKKEKEKADMPLVKGSKAKTRKGFSENVKREMEAGKQQKQAVAIAYSEARSTKRKKK
jgi:hypothetical protein